MLQIKEIVNSIFASKTYILFCEEERKAWLVDIGDVEPVINFCNDKGLTIEGVLLTHVHFDHIYGLPFLLNKFLDCVVFTNEIGKDALANSKMNMSFYHETPITIEGPQIVICGEGDKISLFNNIIVEVYETPGHHPSCLTFLTRNLVFTGDSYIPGVKTVTNLPMGDKLMAQESEKRILKLAEGKILFPGHITT